MNKLLTSTFPEINVHKKRSLNSEIVTQMIYGDSFKILEKKNKWFKIKILEDNYKGFIKEKKFFKFIKATHKVFNLYSKIYKHPSKKQKDTRKASTTFLKSSIIFLLGYHQNTFL